MRNLGLEVRFAAFCAVMIGLGFFYQMVDFEIGSIVFRMSFLTFGLSLAFCIYKAIFGSMGGVLIIAFFLFMYIAAVAHTFYLMDVMKFSFLLGLLVLAIKAFVVIFGGKNSEGDLSLVAKVKCNNCGEEIDGESEFCENCGERIKR